MSGIESIRVDVTPLQSPGAMRRGIGRYVSNLLEVLGRLPDIPPIELFDPLRDELRPLMLPLDVAPSRSPDMQTRPGWLQTIALQTQAYWRRPPRPGEVMLFACHEFAPLFFPPRSVAIVYDLIPQRWGPWARRRRLGWLRDRFQGMRMASAARLIAISEHTRRDALATWGVDPTQVAAIPHLLGPEPAVPSPAPARVREVAGGGAYILYLGARDVRKGLKPLVEAWRDRPASGVRLVVAGGGRSYDPDLDLALAEAERAGRAAVLEDLDEDEKYALLAAAACLVFPSAYEGYGLPVAEAMRVGTPAITFDNSSLPEAAGDGGVVVPDGDYEGMLARAEAMAADPTVRAAASARARAWVRGLDQASIGRRFLEVLREAAGASGAPGA